MEMVASIIILHKLSRNSQRKESLEDLLWVKQTERKMMEVWMVEWTENQLMLQELENLKLLIRERLEHLEELVSNKFTIGQKSPFYSTMESFQMNLLILLIQSNTIISSCVSRKSLTKNTDQTIWNTCT